MNEFRELSADKLPPEKGNIMDTSKSETADSEFKPLSRNDASEDVSLERPKEARPVFVPEESDERADYSDMLDDALKSFGFTSDAEKDNEGNEKKEGTEEKDYSDYLEKGDDGKYYDKETGKAYDSVEGWVKAQETLAKRYESTSEYYRKWGNKEWARYKNAEANGESDAEKREHYKKSQEYYAKAKECKEKAEHIREKLAGKSTSENNTDRSDT